ncbi:ABC transporter substrate-binding protein [Roseovarius sp. A21]|uniref:ABC transporter substrate-binding protein n=1 Tax=Roseovarius bejariae TaxID=2576383 RepID=A0A844CMQ0_9RHOB|nr:ABC transporter substrate-binding protein [Roseovarius bejariae]MRU16621.1 ABC transporter substrate-binding protein [Roseovarius bejariae]
MRRVFAYLVAALLFGGAVNAGEAAPGRVVSINLCTDQLAMLLAEEGQLLSVSHIAQDRRVSAMAQEADRYVINYGLAEEIYLLQPDLVLAGAFTPRATVEMLRRLSIPVAEFAPSNTMEDVRARITRMGEVLHRQGAARQVVRDFDARLARLTTEVERRPRAILYHANGYTSGDSTLAGQILLAAGFANSAEETGYAAGRKLPLEVLAVTDPEIVITAESYPGASRSEAILDHPVVRAMREGRGTAAMTDQDWVCGTPYVLRAIDALAAERDKLTGGAQ